MALDERESTENASPWVRLNDASAADEEPSNPPNSSNNSIVLNAKRWLRYNVNDRVLLLELRYCALLLYFSIELRVHVLLNYPLKFSQVAFPLRRVFLLHKTLSQECV